MESIFRRLFIFSLLLGITGASFSQTIAIGSLDPGPYGSGSSISVPFKIDDPTGKLSSANTFQLFLSDAAGSFASEVQIGQYSGFYTTFINGVIPNSIAPGTGYKLRIKSSSTTVISESPTSIAIQSSAGIVASLDATGQTVSTNPRVFGYCPGGRTNPKFTFNNTSSAGATVTARFTNELLTTDISTISFSSSVQQFTAGLSHYTIYVKAELNGVIGTQSYFLINNISNTAFSTTGNNTVCLPVGILEYGVETVSPTGIQVNFPGNTYRVNWGDGTIDNYTLNQIKNLGSKVKHTYIKSSCGSQISVGAIKYYNVFGIEIQTLNPYCSTVGTPINTQAKVVRQPENNFSMPIAGCINTPISFNNSSIPGESPSATSPICNNNDVVYNWFVDNVLIAQNKPLSFAASYTFATTGTHQIRLESISNSECQADPIEKTICIQNPPKPSFTLPGNIVCLSQSVKPTDNSIIDANCNAGNSYQWSVTGPGTVLYANNTSAGSKSPEFTFTKAGVYSVKLGINTISCGLIETAAQTIVVNDKPAITANWQTNLCGKGQLLTFSNTVGNAVSTVFAGTYKDEANTYSWQVSGGAFEFKNNTSATSKEPQILFSDFGTYTITITHTNNCGTETLTKQIKLNESPTVNAGSDQTVCSGTAVLLNGSIAGGTVSSYNWVGGAGTFSPSRNVLNPVYTPSAAEMAGGTIQLSLSVATSNPAPCDKVEDIVLITITPPNKITSLAAKSICTASAVNYQPTAIVAGSTFVWTATGSSNARGFSSSGTGAIADMLSNTETNVNATVTYIITPVSNGCNGQPFTFTVTIVPPPVVVAQVANSTICTGQTAGIALSSNIAGTKYTWTSSKSGNINGNTNQSSPVEIASISDILVNSGNTQGSVTYTFVPVNSAGCTGQPIVATVQISPAPIKADAGKDQKLCSVPTAQLSANNPGLGTGAWTISSGQTGVVFSDNTRPDAIVSGLQNGQTYKFKWTISGPGACAASTDEVEITILAPVANNVISYTGGAVCTGSNISIAGSLPTGGDNSFIYAWEASLDGENWVPVNIHDQQSLDVVGNEMVFFRRKVVSGNCSSFSNIVKIKVQPGIGNNTVSGDQNVCLNTQPALLTGSTPNGADGSYSYQWQQSVDGLAWVNIPLAIAIDYQPLPATKSINYRRIVTSTLCTGPQQSLSNSVKISVNSGAVAQFTWKDDSGCAPFVISAKNISAELSANNGEYSWYVNNKLIGTGAAFPGYTLAIGQSAEIRLEVSGKLGCGTAIYSHTFTTAPNIQAAFSADVLEGCGPVTVKFTNSTNGSENVSYSWNFGNGQTSSALNPSQVTFAPRNDGKDTIYTVSLKAISLCGVTEKTMGILIRAKPIAIFTPAKTLGCSPFKAVFNNTTAGSGNIFNWDFGDGTTLSTTTNAAVSHIYTTSIAKTFTVKLTVVGKCGTDASQYIIKVNPNSVIPQLVVNGNELEGCSPHVVHFSNNSKGATFYNWDFGDGTTLQTNKAPETIVHTFTKGGKYIVKLNASNGCSDTTISQVIIVYPKPDIAFTSDIRSGCNPLTVQFKNQTTSTFSYRWEFGDGTYSTQTNPIHTFSYKNSPYTIKLIAASALGCPDTLELKDYIIVEPPPSARFEVSPDSVIRLPRNSFAFTDKSSAGIVEWKWDFGDKTLSKLQNPAHAYADTGKFIVKLTVTNKSGCSSTYSKTVEVKGFQGTLFLPNAFIPNSTTEELRVFKAKGSGIKEWHMRIFNKWGQVVWETAALDYRGSPIDGWDGNLNGSPAPQGLYVWEIRATFENNSEWAGISTNNAEPKHTGGIYLIR